MLEEIQQQVRRVVSQAVKERYGIALDHVVIERPPSVDLGDLALPLAFELARQLKRAPQQIAEELLAALPPITEVARVEVAGGGYLNLRLERGALLLGCYEEVHQPAPPPALTAPKVIVEHTNINPNKAAHIGHLRNAALGNSFVRLLRARGHWVEVQNYIDNTGVQVADVVVGFQHLEKKTLPEVAKLIAASEPRFDYYCWDLYARVTQFYEEDPKRLELRTQALQEIEEGTGETAKLAECIATAIVRCHLKTMQRLGVTYDVLPRESEILRLKFWDAAFQQLKQRGAIRFVEAGPQKGCWVMPTPGLTATGADAAELEEAKIIVRSNGTVTYVGKDIAYQLWKLGLLGREFGYRRFYHYPNGQVAWMTSSDGEPDAPAFGGGSRVYNVIDARQAYLQEIVVRGVEALGYTEQAKNSIHFSYEIVGLSPHSCRELGIELTPEDARRPFVEVSGRRGLGVKADDLIDALEEQALAEVRARHAELDEAAAAVLAHKIAVAALRFFLLKFTRNVVIAFDFKEALNFDGETGPYVQYAVVRARNIFRKLKEREPGYPLGQLAAQVSPGSAAHWLAGPPGDEFWDIVLSVAELPVLVAVAVEQQEPALVAKYTFQLAQKFSLFYHKHHILSEANAERRAFLLLLTDLVQYQLTRALELLGIEVPERM